MNRGGHGQCRLWSVRAFLPEAAAGRGTSEPRKSGVSNVSSSALTGGATV